MFFFCSVHQIGLSYLYRSDFRRVFISIQIIYASLVICYNWDSEWISLSNFACIFLTLLAVLLPFLLFYAFKSGYFASGTSDLSKVYKLSLFNIYLITEDVAELQITLWLQIQSNIGQKNCLSSHDLTKVGSVGRIFLSTSLLLHWYFLFRSKRLTLWHTIQLYFSITINVLTFIYVHFLECS